MENIVRIASFDIGENNFSWYVEDTNVDELIKLRKKENVQEMDKVTQMKELDDHCQNILFNSQKKLLFNIFMLGKTVHWKNCSLSTEDSKEYKEKEKEKIQNRKVRRGKKRKNFNIRVHNSIFVRMNEILDEHKFLWDTIDMVIIEDQMKRSPNNMKLAHNCMFYFYYHYGNDIYINSEFRANNKYKFLGCPENMSKYSRKKWAGKKAQEIIYYRNEEKPLKIIQNSKKKDDYGDTLIQLQAVKYLIFIQKIY